MTAVAGSRVRRGSGAGGDGMPPPTGGGGGGDDGRGRHRSRLPLVIAAAVGVVVALLVGVLATSKSATQTENEASSILIGKAAPAISGPAVGGGTTSLAAERGKWVLVNFFASWCIPCQQEQGDLVRFQNRHAATGDAAILAVRFNDPDDGPIKQLMDKSGAHWPIVDDVNAKFQWGVTGPPESFIVDPNGVVQAHIVGQVNANQLDTLLGRLEATEAPATSGQTPGPSDSSSPGTAAP